jgi:hypothetical protein
LPQVEHAQCILRFGHALLQHSHAHTQPRTHTPHAKNAITHTHTEHTITDCLAHAHTRTHAHAHLHTLAHTHTIVLNHNMRAHKQIRNIQRTPSRHHITTRFNILE